MLLLRRMAARRSRVGVFNTTECGDLDGCVFLLDSLGDLGGVFNGEGADEFGLAGVLFLGIFERGFWDS